MVPVSRLITGSKRTLVASVTALVLGILPLQAQAAGNKTITDAGQILRFAIPAAAAGISIYKDDYVGLVQLGAAWTATVGTAYLMEHFIRERRPDGSDWHSMPSDSAASAQAGAAYLWHRYGWQYGLPAEALSVFVGYSRVQAKKHHWYDVAAADGLSFGFNMLLVSRYHQPYEEDGFSAGATPDSVSVRYTMNF
ncbi:MAG: PAP2 family protein [Alphaproteobacteria bacterium]|nr:PAP2 family protein [Alphaproteobacteria bacterium]MDE2011582.1 PAP2 family protein [Alphaproteobacteria bacterium]MDE2071928.1 PAP2 family protein [Alphaproteobacteria bacterium]MDE2353050.1 PAP2 family protein [Alphaproteobacteria bacterium]